MWQSTYARAALLFFVVAFLTFMSIAAFPAFVEDMRVRAARSLGLRTQGLDPAA